MNILGRTEGKAHSHAGDVDYARRDDHEPVNGERFLVNDEDDQGEHEEDGVDTCENGGA